MAKEPNCTYCNDTGCDEISDSYLVFIPCKHCEQGPIAQRKEWQRQAEWHQKQAEWYRERLRKTAEHR